MESPLLLRVVLFVLLLATLGTARKLQIAMLCGIVFDLEVTSKTRILSIKKKIYKLRKLTPSDQILMYGAVVLRDDLRLRDYGTPARLDLIVLSDAYFPPRVGYHPSPSTTTELATSSSGM